MLDLFENEENLILLQSLISGESVSVNVSDLSRILGKHRNTIKKKVDILFEDKVLDYPLYQFPALYRFYPLLIAVNLDLPRLAPDRRRFEKWVREDPHIFAAFRSRQGDYDTLLFVYHRDLTSYQLWMESLPSTLTLQYGLSEASANFESSTTYFSNQRAVKYEPSSGIHLLKSDFQEKGEITINEYTLDAVDLEILENLVKGNGVKTNYSLLCEKTGLHRKTVEKRITTFLDEGVLSKPLCRFPNYFAPPNYILTYSLFEIRKSQEKVIREIVRDPHVSIAYKILYGKFNFLLFGNHRDIGDHLKWEEGYREKFTDAIGSANITYLSPQMTIAFHRQIVAVSLIKNKLNSLRGKKLRETMKSNS